MNRQPSFQIPTQLINASPRRRPSLSGRNSPATCSSSFQRMMPPLLDFASPSSSMIGTGDDVPSKFESVSSMNPTVPSLPPMSAATKFEGGESSVAESWAAPPKATAADLARYTSAKAEETIFNSKVAFPLNLTRMLESVESLGCEDIVRWHDHDQSFVIRDIDAFLSDVLPKFFKSSENTKIRSFYRKLNRWGFSMSRKNANNPNNIWHHPEFNRTIAVRALNEALDTGKAKDFLCMTARGRKRRSIEFAEHPFEIGDVLVGMEGDSDTLPTMESSSRDVSEADLGNPLISRMHASMPSLPSARASMLHHERKKWKMSRGLNPELQRPPQDNQNLLSGSLAANNLRHTQSSAAFGGRSSNATFDPMPHGIRRGASKNAVFETIGEGSTSNATFDFGPLLSSAGPSGLLRPSTNVGLVPSAGAGPNLNAFALRAQEMFAAAQAPTNNPFSRRGGGRVGGQNPIASRKISDLFASPAQSTDLHSEMTPQEDEELVDFFGSLAKTTGERLEEKVDGEPDPLPENFGRTR